MYDKYLCMTPEAFETLCKRNHIFQENLNDTTKESVRVFNPLSKKAIDELHLIREVSKDLQRKKEEDMQKAAQTTEERKETEEKADEEKKPQAEK